MIGFYGAHPQQEKFFDRTQSKEIGNSDRVAGVAEFRQPIVAGKSVRSSQASREPGLGEFKRTRLKYLLYP